MVDRQSCADPPADNTAYALMCLYKLDDEFKFFLGYEYLKFENPSPAGFIEIGGGVLIYVNNNAYVNTKILNVYWGGVRYTPHSASRPDRGLLRVSSEFVRPRRQRRV
jgi:hypothetical protein